MKHFKLKEEAYDFYECILHSKEEPIEYWKEMLVSPKALIEIPPMYVRIGTKTRPDSTSISQWKGIERMASFNFTVYITGCEHEKYENIDKERLRDLIQSALDRY